MQQFQVKPQEEDPWMSNPYAPIDVDEPEPLIDQYLPKLIQESREIPTSNKLHGSGYDMEIDLSVSEEISTRQPIEDHVYHTRPWESTEIQDVLDMYEEDLGTVANSTNSR